jgi:hypothetical protein
MGIEIKLGLVFRGVFVEVKGLNLEDCLILMMKKILCKFIPYTDLTCMNEGTHRNIEITDLEKMKLFSRGVFLICLMEREKMASCPMA